MAKQTSRQLVLDRRKALSQGGKNASVKGSTPNRVRSSTDARATRTDSAFVKPKESLINSNNSFFRSPHPIPSLKYLSICFIFFSLAKHLKYL